RRPRRVRAGAAAGWPATARPAERDHGAACCRRDHRSCRAHERTDRAQYLERARRRADPRERHQSRRDLTSSQPRSLTMTIAADSAVSSVNWPTAFKEGGSYDVRPEIPLKAPPQVPLWGHWADKTQPHSESSKE